MPRLGFGKGKRLGKEIMTLKRTELVERLKKLAESEPPGWKELSSGASCYYPSRTYITLHIPCPDCKNEALSLTLYPGDFDSENADTKFDKQFHKRFPKETIGFFRGVDAWEFKKMMGEELDESELAAIDFSAKLKEFFVTRIEHEPEYFDSMPGTKDITIIESYRKNFEKVREQGLDAELIVPEHCPRCGYGLRENNFFLEIKYKDRSCSERIELENAFDLSLMALFLQGKDRYIGNQDREHPIKDHVYRIAELFGLLTLPLLCEIFNVEHECRTFDDPDEWKSMRKLKFGYSHKHGVSLFWLPTIAQMKQLEELKLDSINLMGDMRRASLFDERHKVQQLLGKLSSLTELRVLHLDGCGLKYLDRCEHSYLSFLEKLQKIEVLSLNYSELSENCVKTIGGLSNLKELDLYGCTFIDTDISFITSLRELHTLNLRGAEIRLTQLPADNAQYLNELPNLKKIDADDSILSAFKEKPTENINQQ